MRGFMTVRLGPEDLTNFFDFFPITQRGLQSKKNHFERMLGYEVTCRNASESVIEIVAETLSGRSTLVGIKAQLHQKSTP